MKKLKVSFVTGAIALVFAVVGYQTALLVHYSSVAKISSDRDTPDTVYVEYADAGGDDYPSFAAAATAVRENIPSGQRNVRTRRQGPDDRNGRRYGRHDATARQLRKTVPPRKVESFEFNPNTASAEDLMRLGFSAKQAESIVNYRKKGGCFRRKEDFSKSYVVSDTIYARLENFIVIPKLDINKADSAAFDTLPGIGGYFARKMVEYRSMLHGYSYPEQLMDIYHFDREKYDGIKDLITLSPPSPYALWSLPADSLQRHPYIKRMSTARSIVFFRENNAEGQWTLKNLLQAGILTAGQTEKLERCVIGR